MTPEQILRTYADLADLYDRQSQPKQRDWFLVLAADAANAAGKSADADRYLGRLLAVNPHHLLKPFGSFVEALRSPDVEGYVLSLRRSYPPDRAEQLLVTERNKILTASATAPSSPPPPAREPPREPPPKPPAGPELFNTLAPQEPPRVIYARVRDEEQAPTAALPPVPPPAPPPPQPAPLPPRKVERAQPLPMPKPRPQPRAAEPPPEPEPAPTPPPRAAGRRRAAPPPEPEFDPGPEPSHEGSPFLPTVLFLVVLGFGLGLAAYAFVRPFLAPEWLR